MRIKRSTKKKPKSTRGRLKMWKPREKCDSGQKRLGEMEFFGIWFEESSRESMWMVKREKEMWWWNEEVAEVIKRKKEGYKKWRKDRSEENLEAYKVLKKEVR